MLVFFSFFCPLSFVASIIRRCSPQNPLLLSSQSGSPLNVFVATTALAVLVPTSRNTSGFIRIPGDKLLANPQAQRHPIMRQNTHMTHKLSNSVPKKGRGKPHRKNYGSQPMEISATERPNSCRKGARLSRYKLVLVMAD